MYNHIPSLLLLEALLFLLPGVVWHLVSRKLGSPLLNLETKARKVVTATSKESEEHAIKQLAADVGDYCTRNYRNRLAYRTCRLCYGNQMFLGYLMLLMLWATNVIAQFFVLGRFLGAAFYKYGLEVFASRWRNHLNETSAEENMLNFGLDPLHHGPSSFGFPRTVACRFSVLHVTRVHDYVVQCDLPLAEMNEGIMLFVWNVLFAVACVTASRLLAFFIEFLVSLFRGLDIGQNTVCHGGKAELFANVFLGRDGVFMLKMISEIAGSATSGRVAMELSRMYEKEVDNFGPNAQRHPWETVGNTSRERSEEENVPRSDSSHVGRQQINLEPRKAGKSLNRECADNPPPYNPSGSIAPPGRNSEA